MIRRLLFSFILLLSGPCYVYAGGIDGNTVLMLHCNGTDASTTITDDSSSAHTVTANGDFQIDTAIKKFGTGSCLTDGTGDYASIANHANFDYSSGDWTIDFWAYPTASGTQILGKFQQAPPYSGWYLSINGSNAVLFYSGDNALRITSTNTLTNSAWNHIALVGSSNTVYMYIGGTQQAATWAGNPTEYNTALLIGIGLIGGSGWVGQLDEIRFSDGTARYTANFTPETTEYTSDTTAQVIIIGSQKKKLYQTHRFARLPNSLAYKECDNLSECVEFLNPV